jgi:predicted permease
VTVPDPTIAMLQDLRLALRLALKDPGYSLAAVAVLAVGLGLNSAMLTLVYSFAFSPRPYAEPERIVQLYTQDRRQPDRYRLFSQPLWQELRARADLFAAVLAFSPTLVGVEEGQSTRRALAAVVSADFFSTLGVPLQRGRGFTAEEERPGAALPVVVVSHTHWRRTGFAPDLLGSRLRVNGQLCTVVGIAPEGFSGTTALIGPELYFPLGMHAALENFVVGEQRRSLEQADAYHLFLVARLAPGVEPGSAGAALEALGTRLEQAFPVEFRDQTVALGPLPRLGNSSSPRSETAVTVFGGVLLALSGAVLLVVCLNLAGLVLARGAARRREFAVRLALGAPRHRLVRQLCLEGLLLAVVGGGLGLLAAQAALAAVTRSLEERLPLTIFTSSPGSGAILVGTAAVIGLATLAFSLGPALRLSGAAPLDGLRLAAGDDTSRARGPWWRPRHPLVVVQTALSLGLLIVAGLFLRMVASTTALDHGFRADDTVVAEVDASLAGLDETQGLERLRAAEERLGRLPGVRAAAVAAIVPYGFVYVGRDVRRDGPAPAADAKPATAAEGRAYPGGWNAVGADYFSVLGLPLKAGRAFTAAEAGAKGAPRVAILDERLARQLWPEGDALGRFIRFAGRAGADAKEDGAMQVVGIVGGTRTEYFDDGEEGAVYVPFAQGYFANAHFHVQPAQAGRDAALALLPTVRAALAEAAPGVPVFQVRPFRDHADASIEVWAMRLGSNLLVLFSGFTVAVAVVGLYSVKAYQVARRTREIGIRMALGAEPTAVQGLVLREGLATAATGIGVGLLLGLGLNRALASFLHGVAPLEPVVLLGAAAIFLGAAALAAWIPARRATRVSPLEALRAE